MSGFPDYSGGYPPTGPADDSDYWPPETPKTSGFAIASLIFGILGLLSCCIFLPSLLGTIFGGVALSTIKRGEASGRGTAIAGTILSVLGLLLGAGLWIFIAVSPSNVPVPGSKVSESQRRTLIDMGILQPDENIELLYTSGMVSMREGGAVITGERLVLFSSSGPEDACMLVDIVEIDHDPADHWLADGSFILTLEDGRLMTFTVDGIEAGDKLFNRVLKTRVTRLREAADRPPPQVSSQLMPEDEDEGGEDWP